MRRLLRVFSCLCCVLLILCSAVSASAASASYSGNPVVVTGDASCKIDSLVLDLETVQAGSGEASVDNVRPVLSSGSISILQTDFSQDFIQVDVLQSGTGVAALDNVRSFVGTSFGDIFVYGGYLDILHGLLTVTHFTQTVVVDSDTVSDGSISAKDSWTGEKLLRYSFYPSGPVWDVGRVSEVLCDSLPFSVNWGATKEPHFTVYSNQALTRFVVWLPESVVSDGVELTFCYPLLSPLTYQLNYSSVSDILSDLGYSALTYSVSFPASVYTGTVDVTNGILTVTHDCIDSYKGEVLPGAWLSSMDVYSSGKIPTIGAQVVYELAVSKSYLLDPVDIPLLDGKNTFFCDTGNITVSLSEKVTSSGTSSSGSSSSGAAGGSITIVKDFASVFFGGVWDMFLAVDYPGVGVSVAGVGISFLLIRLSVSLFRLVTGVHASGYDYGRAADHLDYKRKRGR